MPSLAYAAGSAALALTGSFAVASAVATALPYALVAAAGIGLSYAQQQKQLQALDQSFGSGSGVNNDRSLQQIVFDANPAIRLPLGTAIHSGIPYFADGTLETKPYLTYGLCLAGVPCGDLLAVWINNQRVQIGANGFSFQAPFSTGSVNHIEVQYQPGSPTQSVNPILAREFGKPDSFKLPMMAEVVIRAHYGEGGTRAAAEDKHRQLYGQDFQPVFEHEGALKYDPRSPDHDLSDIMTWSPSSNASLGIMRYIQWKFPSMYIDWDLVAVAADIDDEWMFDKNGNAYRRHAVNGVITDADDAFTVVNDLLTSNGGMLIRKNGRFYPLPAQKKQPIGTIHAGMVRGGYQIDLGQPYANVVEQVIPEFFSTERERSFVPAPAIGTSGTDKKTRTLRLAFENNSTRAQKSGRRAYNRAQRPKTVSISVDNRASSWFSGQVVRIHFDGIHATANGTYEIVSMEEGEFGESYVLALQEYNEADEDFNSSTQEQDFLLVA